MEVLAKEQIINQKQERESIFYNLTRSVCPTCKKSIDAQILIRNNKVIMKKRCQEHGWFEALLSSDFENYRYWERFNKPGTLPLEFQTEVKEGCPSDCGLCSSHQQHTCLGILEITQSCNYDCPVCFASSGISQKHNHLDFETIKGMVNTLIRSEGTVELIQISGGEPTIHPQIIEIIKFTRDTDHIQTIMINSNGRRFAKSVEFCEKAKNAGLNGVYLQFDGFDSSTYKTLRGNSELLGEKLDAIKNLSSVGIKITLSMTVVKGINDNEIGEIIRFIHKTPGINGLSLQPVFAEGRLEQYYDPMDHLTLPDILQRIEEQTNNLYRKTDFFPIPCPYPHCSGITFSYQDPETGEFTTIKRIIEVEDYLDYFKNSITPDVAGTIKDALEGLFSFSTSAGSRELVEDYCNACGIDLNLESIRAQLGEYIDHVKMITIKPFMSAWDVDVKRLMKCCVHEVLPDNKIIPFCAYNILYRDKYNERYFNNNKKFEYRNNSEENKGINIIPLNVE
ncbi:MAG: Cyclic pyranopterin monophosphate synthase [Candidatus Heimdallarchaeota archaeon LC_3]|nr:MAG: Cyclic pyranopterin monophosphate synthase [Candidatus Heimdallarchaeota archaeon LC_3]